MSAVPALEAWTLLAALAASTTPLRLGVIVTSNRIRPPAVVLAKMAAMLDVSPEDAAVWNAPTRTIDEFRHKTLVLDEPCAAIGRDPRTIARSKQILVNAADRSAAAAATQSLLEHIDAGTTHLILTPIPPLPDPAWLAEHVAQPVLGQLATR